MFLSPGDLTVPADHWSAILARTNTSGSAAIEGQTVRYLVPRSSSLVQHDTGGRQLPLTKVHSKGWICAMQHEREKTKLGLQRGRVELRSHHVAWGQAFQDERERLAEIVGSKEYSFEHVGSTSVEGLPAKPILDIALLVKQPELISRLRSTLCSNGYIYRGNHSENGGHLFVFESSPNIRSIHLHAVLEGDPQWDAYLKFRWIMRSNARLRTKYGRLKADLAAELADDRASYTAAKAEFLQAVLSSKLNC